MKVTIIGAGNIGTLMAAEFAYRGYDVTIYTSHPDCWKGEIEVYDVADHFLYKGKILTVTNSIQKAVIDAEYIWITMPAQMFETLGERLTPFIHKSQKLGIMPGTGGSEFAFQQLIKKGVTMFGCQRVQSVARLKKYGESVYELGRKSELQIGSIPAFESPAICKDVSEMFNMPCFALDNYLAVTLTPSNPILHTTRLYSMFKEYEPGKVYSNNSLFYEDWTDDASRMLIACDAELQGLCKVIPLDLNSVISLKDHYESWTVETMSQKIRNIKAFKGLWSPMKKTENGWIPDWASRYFATDFSFGLKVFYDIAKLFFVATPNMAAMWNWYKTITAESSFKITYANIHASDFEAIYGHVLGGNAVCKE